MTMGEVTMQTGGSASVLALDIKRALDVPSSATAVRPFGSLAPPKVAATKNIQRARFAPSRAESFYLLILRHP